MYVYMYVGGAQIKCDAPNSIKFGTKMIVSIRRIQRCINCGTLEKL